MKKLFIATIAITIIGGAFFSSCQKDNEAVIKTKSLKSTVSDNLKSYELYTPDETTIETKLLLITSYLNNLDEDHMPDMELKEAIWYLEAFFNIGVCDKQEFYVEVADLTQTYSITIPLLIDSNGILFLSGRDLQIEYSDLLESIVSEICLEYAINFGDLYVENINLTDETVTLTMEIKYGQKAVNLSNWSRFLKIVGRNFSPVEYPHGAVAYTYYVWNTTVRDEGMTITLNQERTRDYVCGIIDVRIQTQNNNTLAECFMENLKYGVTTVGMYNQIYDSYGYIYRDDIWNNIVPRIYSSSYGYPTEYKPLWAYCNLVYSQIPNRTVKHAWGIEKICTYMTKIVLTQVKLITYKVTGMEG